MENNNNRKISSSQLMYLLICFILGSVLLLSFEDNTLKQDSWVGIVAAFIACTPFVLSVAFLAKKFPGKSLIDILSIIYGRILGKAFFVLYAGYFFILLSFNLRDLADFYIGYIMPETPMAVFLIITMLVSGYAVHKGIASIAKVGFLSAIYSFLSIIITFLLLLKDMDFTNFLPMFAVPADKFIQGTHILSALPFGEVFVFLMVMPSLRTGQNPVKVVYGGVGIAAVAFLIITVRNIAVLGPSSAIYAGNSYQATRIINIGEFLTRVELLTAIGITIGLFTKISVLFYATVKSTSQLFQLKSDNALLLPLGGLAIVLAIIAFDSTIAHQYVAGRYHAFFSLLFAFIIPPLSLLIAVIKGLPRESGGDG
jgi:spore germination protein KB